MAISIAENRDCMEAMKEFPDGYFDLCVCDSPYGIGVMSMNYTKSGAVRTHGYSAAKRRDYRKQSEWDVKPSKEVFDEIMRVSKNWVIWGANYLTDLLPPSKAFICWDKRCDDNMRNDFSDCELAFCSTGVARMFRFVWNGMIQGDMKNKQERFHPTEKPYQLYAWIYQNYLPNGGKVLDPFLGSGSSRIAAYDAGLDFWGYEIDKVYFDKQEERFDHHAAQQNLFLME